MFSLCPPGGGGCPSQVSVSDGGVPPSFRIKGIPLQLGGISSLNRRYPWAGWGYPTVRLDGSTPLSRNPEKHSEYLLHSGRCASCAHSRDSFGQKLPIISICFLKSSYKLLVFVINFEFIFRRASAFGYF